MIRIPSIRDSTLFQSPIVSKLMDLQFLILVACLSKPPGQPRLEKERTLSLVFIRSLAVVTDLSASLE